MPFDQLLVFILNVVVDTACYNVLRQFCREIKERLRTFRSASYSRRRRRLLVFISNVVVDTGSYNVLGQFYWEINE